MQQNKIGAQAGKMEGFTTKTTEEKTMKASKSFIGANSQEKVAGIPALAKEMHYFSLMVRSSNSGMVKNMITG